ncbi:MAG TPA: methyltransferase domain-containing protein [Bryobacteraceae bacterium]|nr:methyltransferase domain-containing protein [Bryobacteraceae bacterium]
MKRSVFLMAALSIALPFAWAQTEHPVSGRRIAGVMGVGGADWLDRTERESEELPETALDKIGLKPGMTVADVGAGSGYFTLRLSKRVGPTGKVAAVEIQPEMMAILRRRISQEKLQNVEAYLSSETDPRLPKNSMDLILMVDVYHEFSQPQVMLRKMKEALKPTGRLVLLEYRKEDPHIPIRVEHKMSVREAEMELGAEGFKLEKVLKDLPRQHILIFRKDVM